MGSRTHNGIKFLSGFWPCRFSFEGPRKVLPFWRCRIRRTLNPITTEIDWNFSCFSHTLTIQQFTMNMTNNKLNLSPLISLLSLLYVSTSLWFCLSQILHWCLNRLWCRGCALNRLLEVHGVMVAYLLSFFLIVCCPLNRFNRSSCWHVALLLTSLTCRP